MTAFSTVGENKKLAQLKLMIQRYFFWGGEGGLSSTLFPPYATHLRLTLNLEAFPGCRQDMVLQSLADERAIEILSIIVR